MKGFGKIFNWKEWLSLLLLLLPAAVFAQQSSVLTLEEAQQLARQHYPVSRQLDLLQQTEKFTLQNLNKNYLPQISLNGQFTYQSDVPFVPVSVPNLEIPPPPKDQYKIVADVSQVLYDGGQIRQQKKTEQLNTVVENQKVEIELQKLRDRVNQLYLGTLLLDAQLKQINLVQLDLEAGIRKVEAQVKNGVSFKSNLYLLQAELLKNEQRRAELSSSRKATLQTLGLFTGKLLDEDITLVPPTVSETTAGNEIQRPELKLYSGQKDLLEQRKKVLQSRNLPKLNLFGQGGFGNPGLNVLLDEPAWWYIAGVRLHLPLNNFYTFQNDKKLLGLNQQLTDVQRETFLLNTNAQLTQQQAEIEKMEQLLLADQEIVALRQKVKEAANAQLENGVITPNDFLREVYAEDQARQTLILHQLQLLQAQLNYQATLGY